MRRTDYVSVRATRAVANFVGTPVAADPTLTVAFQDQSTGPVSSWSWDFGDNTSSTERHPIHKYDEQGRHTVTLSVSGSDGVDTRVRTTDEVVGDEGVGGDGTSSPKKPHILYSPEEIRSLPTTGAAWESLLETANEPLGKPNIGDMTDNTDVQVLAKALAFVRLGEPSYRREVVYACMAAMGTEDAGNALALSRNLASYVIAADLVGLPPSKDARFRQWLRQVRDKELSGRTLISTHEDRPNNWGTHAGGSRMCVAVYLGDESDLERAAQVFRGFLGARDSYAQFHYGELWWQPDPELPVGIAPAGATMDGYCIDGVLPDDQRRGGPFAWPPPHENYVYEALQGSLLQAMILDRAGYDVWNWEDRALLRAFSWLHEEAEFPAEGDDDWQPHVINHYYGTDFPAPVPTHPGKIVGWTDWTHGS
jgi:PKD repeat protein